MNRFGGFDDARKAAASAGGMKLPAGAYVCKILNVKYEKGQNGNSDMIQIMFDIDEGEQKDFFKKQYEANTSEDKKWKGKHTIYCPKDDGTKEDGWTKRSFAGWTLAFENSNKDYTWDWDESKWKGLVVGIVFGETGNVINGRNVTYTESRFACDVEKVRNNTAAEAQFLAKNGYVAGGNNQATNDSFMSLSSSSEEDVPWA